MRTIPCEPPAITFSALSAEESNSTDSGSVLITVSTIRLPAGTCSSGGSNLWPRMVKVALKTSSSRAHSAGLLGKWKVQVSENGCHQSGTPVAWSTWRRNPAFDGGSKW
jgi:hypothetical protein